MTEIHRPDLDFADRLEARLAGELRRLELFGPPRRARPPRRLPRLAALLLAGVVLGAGGAVAAERLQDASRTELVEARARIRLETAERRLAILREREQELERLAAAGVLPSHELGSAASDREAGELELARRRLDLEEVWRSGRAPDDALTAPPVAGRDFVGERLSLGLDSAHRRADLKRERLEETRRLVEAGFLSPHEARAGELALAAAEAEPRDLELRLSLRRRYLAGELEARQVDLEWMRAQAELRLEAARAALEHTARRVEETRRLHAAGVLPSSELREHEREELEREAELRLAEIELRIVRQEMGQ